MGTVIINQELYSNGTYFYVVRDTDHPAEDLARNWSSFVGGSVYGETPKEQTAEAAKANAAAHIGADVADVKVDFRFHPAYNAFAPVDYYGLGAFELQSETLDEAIKEAIEQDEFLACCTGAGDGHFDAADCVGYAKAADGRYVFMIAF